MLEQYYLRRPTLENIELVLALMIACDKRDVGFPDSDLSDLQAEWDRINLAQDAWLAIDKQNKLQGYGVVLPASMGNYISVYDAPGTEGSDLFLSLSVLCEGRARYLLNKENNPEKQTMAHYISDSATYQKEILTEAGYVVTKHLYNLHVDLNHEIPDPKWPAGLTLRTVNQGTDDKALHALIQDAFYKPDRTSQTLEDWQAFMMNPSRFVPELWFLLEKDSELIGCVLCFEYEELGWVRQLAVREDQRGKGLGRKLLQHAFHVFKKRGFPKVGLAAESKNETALSLYTSAGMHQVIHLNEFSKKITIS